MLSQLRLTFFLLCFFWTSHFACAQIIFTEVMYDLEGADTGREWVEIKNEGASSVDISSYKLRENDVNHGLVIQQGDVIVPAGGYVVIVDNPTKFLADYPGFSGTYFDSSFSLSNSGETLIFRDANLTDLDQLSYTSEWGAVGDGKSLQKNGVSWVATLPTPGDGGTDEESSSSGNTSEMENTSLSSGETSTSTSTTSSSWPVEQQIFVNAGQDKTAMAGADVLFQGKALGLEKKPLENARYLWNFGDGEIKEGQQVFHAYRYPGVHMVTLSVASGSFSSEDRAIVTVVEARASLTEVVAGSYVEISNHSIYDLDLSRWQVVSGRDVFVIPDQTIILAGKRIRFAWQTLKFTEIDKSAGLFYPSGAAVTVSSASPTTSLVETNQHQEKIKLSNVIPNKEISVAAVAVPLVKVSSSDSLKEERNTFQDTSYSPVADFFSGLLNKWTIMFFLLIVISSGAYISLRFFAPSKSIADEFEIIE